MLAINNRLFKFNLIDYLSTLSNECKIIKLETNTMKPIKQSVNIANLVSCHESINRVNQYQLQLIGKSKLTINNPPIKPIIYNNNKQVITKQQI